MLSNSTREFILVSCFITNTCQFSIAELAETQGKHAQDVPAVNSIQGMTGFNSIVVVCLLSSLKGGCREVGVGLLLCIKVKDERKLPQVAPGEVQISYQKKKNNH